MALLLDNLKLRRKEEVRGVTINKVLNLVINNKVALLKRI